MSVRNWATEFDHFDPAYAADPFAVWDELRIACPVARSAQPGSQPRDNAALTR